MSGPSAPKIHLDQMNGGILLPAVAAAMKEALSFQGNPSSFHKPGRQAAAAIERSRQEVAQLIQAHPQEIVFTSSGTEANALALLGIAKAYPSRGRHLVVSAVEHLSVLHLIRQMEKEGFRVTLVGVDRLGRVDPEALEQALTDETILVSIQWANGEVGTLQPMGPILERVKPRGILIHSDAVSAVGQVPVNVRQVPVDALSMTSSSFGGPPGVGALYLRHGVRVVPLFVGGAQEEGRRAGTENVVGIVGFGQACRVAGQEMEGWMARLIPLRDRLIHGILNMIPEASLNGDPAERLPGHVSMSVPGVDAQALVLSLDREGISVGLGSACTARSIKASHVLKAMGVEQLRALGTITLTLGPQVTQADIEFLLDRLPPAVARQRGEVPV